jgi:hypothetical protein
MSDFKKPSFQITKLFQKFCLRNLISMFGISNPLYFVLVVKSVENAVTQFGGRNKWFWINGLVDQDNASAT